MEKLVIAGREFNSRLFLGTGKFNSNEVMEQAILASGTEMVTVAMKRIDMDNKEDDMMKHIIHPNIQLLPNTSGVRNAEEAVFAAQLAREAFGTNWLKLEIHPDPRYLLPDSIETLKATEELVDGAQVDGQRVDLAVMRGIHAVHVVREAREAVHVIPDALVGGVEQVGAVLVDLCAGLLVHIRVGVAADVIADIDDVHAGAGVLHRLLRHRQAKQARADNYQIRVLRALRRAVLRILCRICHDSKPFMISCAIPHAFHCPPV